MGSQLFVDLYGCDKEIINDLEQIKKISKNTISFIGAEIVEECFHKFEPIGITYIAVITTSHFSIHTWPEYGYVAIDVFSCNEEIPNKIVSMLKEAFLAKKVVTSKLQRNIKGGV